jgi:two-component system cell cycle sensor histidine kinase/response regulator CckA
MTDPKRQSNGDARIWTLRESVSRLRTMANQTMVGFGRLDSEGRFVDCNPALAGMFDHTWQDLIGIPFCDLVAAEQQQDARDTFSHAISDNEKELSGRYAIPHKSGATVWLNLSMSIVRDTDLPTIFVAALDVSDQMEVENALTRSERNFRLLIEEMTSGTALHEIITDDNGEPVDYRFLAVNPAFEAQTGLKGSDIVGKTVKEVLPGTEDFWIKTFGKVALTGEPTHFEQYSEALEKHYLVNAYSPEPRRFAVVFNDITQQKRVAHEREQLQQQVLHAQKLESLGVLAGGIAHDFNNLLMAILGNAELALTSLPASSPARREILEIEKASKRAADLCRQMLAYSGRGEFVVEPINICELIKDMTGMLDVSISKRAVLKLNLGKVPAIEADVSQIQQVIMNLIINAAEAIEGTNGIISVTTGSMQCDEGYLLETYLDKDIGPGNFVFMEISDNGCGMSPEVADRIFEPFFTTKFAGRGLGMAAVMGVVRGHKGTIKVYSEPGKGTTFKVLLPASDRKPVPLADAEKDESESWKPNGTVLLVDDEEFVVRVGRSMLRKLGFDVITAHGGRRAIEAYKSNRDEICCVLLDLTMPGMDGHETFRELRAIDPEAKVILCSGYNEHDAVSQFGGKRLSGFIQKPYHLSGLQEVLKTALTQDH